MAKFTEKQEQLTVDNITYQITIDERGRRKVHNSKNEYLGFVAYCAEMRNWFGETRGYEDPTGLEKLLCKVKYFETKEDATSWLLTYKIPERN